MADVHLVRDVLDEQLFDRNDRRCGKVDGIILALRPGAPPRVIAIEAGGPAAARRLWKPLARLLLRGVRRWGLREPYRIPWNLVKQTGPKVALDLDAADTPLLRWEDRVRERIIGRIPGS